MSKLYEHFELTQKRLREAQRDRKRRHYEANKAAINAKQYAKQKARDAVSWRPVAVPIKGWGFRV